MPGKVRFQVDDGDFQARASELISGLNKYLKEEWIPVMESIKQQSKKEVPKKTGRLQNSFDETWLIEGNILSWVALYDTPYACRQHEDLDLHHKGGRKAKYLSDPIAQHKNQVERATVRGVNKAVQAVYK